MGDFVIEGIGLDVGYNEAVLKGLNFGIRRNFVTCIVGESGCGKSTLLRNLFGLSKPLAGRLILNGIGAGEEYSEAIKRCSGVLFQNSALWSSMDVFENIAMPLRLYAGINENAIAMLVNFYLEIVGLSNCERMMPSELSGGMKKRVALARALVSEPKILFLDEPSAGLDPISSRQLDELILFVQNQFKTTIVVVSHELNSIFRIADEVIFLDSKKSGILEIGSPEFLKENAKSLIIKKFFTNE